MSGRRNKEKIPTYKVNELEEERINNKVGKKIEDNLNGLSESNKSFFNKVVGTITKLKFKNKKQQEFYEMILSKEFTICKGSAGTGKTFLAVHAALKLLSDPSNKFNEIILIKSVTTLPSEDIGYLKGSASDKLGAFYSSYQNVFEKFMTESNYRNLIENRVIREVGLFQIRGWDLSNAIVIIDEAQNLTHHVMKTAMTRIGYDSKLIILGDNKQVDLKNRNMSSLEFIYEKFKNVKQFGIFEFTLEDVVRNPVIQFIERIFEEREVELENKKIERNKKLN